MTCCNHNCRQGRDCKTRRTYMNPYLRRFALGLLAGYVVMVVLMVAGVIQGLGV